MRKIFENIISISIAFISLLLCILWFYQSGDIEPMLGIIASLGVLLTGVVYRIFPEKKEDFEANNIAIKHNVVENSLVSACENTIVGNQNTVVKQYITYAGDRKIPHILTSEPFKAQYFFGREKELEEIHDRLFSPDGNLLMLVNGDGGVGKTALASAYFFKYKDEYTHVAWLLSQQSIANAMLELELPLGLPLDEKLDMNARLTRLLAAMANLKKPCLLILDNANETDDLKANYIRLRQCSRFHLLLTTRVTEFFDAAFYKIQGLPLDNALTMFEKYYRKLSHEERELFGRVRIAVGENTLVLELFARNLRNVNKLDNYTLSHLWSDLQSKGLFGLAQSTAVDTAYHPVDGQLRHEKPETIISAMYDLSGLTAGETALLSVFAVLPAETISFGLLETLLTGNTELNEQLLSLSQKGWIEFNETTRTFKCSPVIQEVTRNKNPNLRTDCDALIDTLLDKLEYQQAGHLINATYAEAQLYARYAEAALAVFNVPDYNLLILSERIGEYHSTTGNIERALFFFDKNAQIAKDLYDDEPNNPDYKNGLAISYEKLGETHSALGNLEKALNYYEDETVLFEELYEAFPQNVSFKNSLAISYEKLGDTHATLGNLEKALKYYVDETVLFEELYKAFPQNVSFKNGLAISYSKLGTTHAVLGNLEKALKYYEQYLELREALYKAFPQNVSFKNGLAISYSKLGETHATLGNLEKALKYYEQYLELREELFKAFPQNVSFKNGLAVSYEKLGETHATLGNLEKALKYYEQYLELREELFKAFPQNVSFKNGLAISYEKLGDTHATLGNLEKALKYYEDETVLFEELYKAFPQNVSFKNGLAISYLKLGETHSALGNLEKALKYFEDETVLFEELYKAFPQNVSFKNGLAISYEKLGNTHSALGNLEKALKYYEDMAVLFEELYEAFPQNVEFKNNLAISYSKLGNTHTTLGNQEKALKYYEDMVVLFEELYKAFPQNVSFKNGLAISFEKLGETHSALGNLEKALKYFEDETVLFEALYEAYPQNVSFKNGLAISYWKLGDLNRTKNDKTKARQYFIQAEKLWEELVRDAQGYAQFQQFLAQVRQDLKEL